MDRKMVRKGAWVRDGNVSMIDVVLDLCWGCAVKVGICEVGNGWR